MSGGSAPEQDLQDTRDELTQASIALNTAYGRLQDLRASLRNFTAQRDSIQRTHQQVRPQNVESMGPGYSAIVLSDSDEESDIDMEALRESLPSRLLELTSRWGHQHARLHAAARHATSAESGNSFSPPSSTAMTPEEPRPIYPPLRRRRLLPPAGSSSRDIGTISPPSATSPARRSFLEAHLRYLRHASNPGDSSTTLGRRVTQRAAAAASEREATGTGAAAPSDTIIHSTLPLGLEPRPPPSTSGSGSVNPRSIESRAAAHLRHSLLPNPSSGNRAAGVRIGPTNAAHARLNERTEHRSRIARSNSLASPSHSGSASTASSVTPQGPNLDATSQAPMLPRTGEVMPSFSPMSEGEAMRFGHDDPLHASYRVRRHVNAQGEEQVFSINWSELMSEGDRDEDASDPSAWMRPARRPPLPFGHPSRARPEPDTDDTIVRDAPPASSRETRLIGREDGGRRRRGWARLDPDGDEISTEDEASLERVRTELRHPRTRNWGRNGTAWAAGRGSTVAVLDFVHHNSRDAATGHRDPSLPSEGGLDGEDISQRERTMSYILDGLFHPQGTVYRNPLPVHYPEKERAPQCHKEVWVVMDAHMAGR